MSTETPRPKPAPPKPKAPARPEVQEVFKRDPQEGKEKPKFVRKPHLTERPFKEHPGLQELHRQLEKKAPRRGQRRTNKEEK